MLFKANYQPGTLIKKFLLLMISNPGYRERSQGTGRRKIFLAMKITTILLLTASLTASAGGFAQKVTLAAQNVRLEKVFKEIKKQTGYVFFYDANLLKRTAPVSLDVKNVSVQDVLKEALEGEPLDFSIERKTITIVQKEGYSLNRASLISNVLSPLSPLFREIKGTVKDDKGSPLSGVSVVVKGTTKGTSTATDGSFFIDANMGDVLEFSFVGYKKTSITVGNNTNITVQLSLDITASDEVVVVGYGTKKKINLTGAVSVVKGAELENRPVLDATQSLQGLVPGLNVSVGGNTKPGQSFNLNIRGAGNLAGGDGPFVLVDGLPMSLSDVNPNDIESISVLKDAAASAIYGARAPFGVILVTTKKGKADHTTISYSNNFGITRPINLPVMANSYDFALYYNAATFNAQGNKQYSDAKLALLKQYIDNPAGINIFPEATDNYLSNWENTANGVANTNWFDFFYKPSSFRQQHNLSVSGGNKTTQYFVSGGYYDEDGLMRFADIKYRRFNFNTTLTSQVTGWAKLTLNSKITQDKYTAPFSSGGTFEGLFLHNLARMRPNISPYDLNGNFNEISSVPYFRSGSQAIDKNFTFVLLPAIELEPVKNWKVIADLNIRRDEGENSTLLLPGVIYGIDGTPKFVNRSEFGIPLLGSFSRNENTNVYVSPNIYTSYHYILQKDHDFNLMVGFQQELNEFSSLTSSAQDLISANRPGISLSTRPPVTSELRNHWATQGYFGRLSYNYKEKYLLELNGRYDGSSRFAPDSRWGVFPSMSVGYNIAKEDFMKNLRNVINTLKLRASYGLLGNQSGAGLYSYIQSMGVSIPGINGAGPGWFFQNGREGVIFAPAPFNPGTTWEKVYTKNLGIDFDLLHNSLSGSVDVYERETKDMLGPSFDIADIFGGSVPPSNNANLRTRGWELSLTYRGKIGNNVNFSTGVVFSDNVTTVTKYANPTFTDPSGSWYVGKKAGEIWGYKASGLLQDDADAATFNALNHTFLSPVAWKAGDVKYLDLNKDGAINRGNNRLGDMGDLSVIGNSSPRYAYSFNGSIEWKGLSLYVLFQGIGKRDFAPGVGDVYFWGSGALAQVSVFKEHLNYWTPDNPNAYYPNPYAAPAGAIGSFINKTQQVSNRYLQSAAYLRLKNATLGYSLPKSIIGRLKLSKVNVFASGENLFTITKLAGMFDPETLTGSTSTGKIYPLSQVYSFGLNIGL
jgi:TonB-linked SusC/RagA family outer membrane protein